jgi:predicted nuclease of predicted toxin-antitoxin system
LKLLLDESLPEQLRKELPGHDVATVREAGWSGKSNGERLALASREFDIFITPDRDLRFQQDQRMISIGVIVLECRSNRMEQLLPLVPSLKQAIMKVRPGKVAHVR